jgi:hypothetical protein
MRTLVFILSAAAILFFTTCEEDNPLYEDHIAKARTIKIFNLSDSSTQKIWNVYGNLYDRIVLNGNTITYSTYYTDGDYEHGYGYGGKLVVKEFVSPFDTYTYYAPLGQYIINYSSYPEENSIFVSAGDIYRIVGRGSSVNNLTTSFPQQESCPLYVSTENLLIYKTQADTVGMIIKQDLNTSQKDTLVKSADKYPLTPLFVTEDERFLIYSEPSSIYYPDILSIKSLEIANPQNIRVLAGGLSIRLTGMVKSHDDKTAFSSDGQIYVLDLNTSELTPIGSGEFASISNNGEKVVFTQGFELFIINSDGSNLQSIVKKTSEKKYLFLPFFSTDDNQVVFVESNYPRYY